MLSSAGTKSSSASGLAEITAPGAVQRQSFPQQQKQEQRESHSTCDPSPKGPST